MGTMLQAAGLPVGTAPELWNLQQPDTVAAVGARYVAAGSDIIYANTFGANRHKLAGADVAAVVAAGVAAAKQAAAGKAKVALDIGPIGQLLQPLGTLSFDEAYDIFKEVATAGEQAGADLIVLETMSDLYEVKAGVLAAKENTRLPVWVTMTFEKTGRTFLGVTVAAMALTLTGLGVDALGFNCSLGPRELLPLVEELAAWTDLPLILKPNAGLPDPATGEYRVAPDEFAADLAAAARMGVTVFGGCCGTTPAFIAAAKETLATATAARPAKTRHGVCSGTRAVAVDGVKVVGERINPTGKKRFQQALRDGEWSYILEQGIAQQDAGADILDVNVGLPGLDEAAAMKQAVTALQGVVDLPLQIDSSHPAAIEAGLRYYNGKAIVNSVNGEKTSLDTILPLCKKYGAAVVGLTMDKTGIPHTAEERIAIAEKILAAALRHGIPREDVYIDCLTLTVSAQQEHAAKTLKAVRHVSEVMGLHTTLGVSNISFGLPAREKVTAAFLTQALGCGLTLPIINPSNAAVMDAVCAHRALWGQDAACEAYIARFAGVESTPLPPVTEDITLETAIAKGLKEEAMALTRAALETLDEMAVVNTRLIPALDAVGERYEKQEIFLPQLLNAANAACAGFEVVKTRLAQRGAATVSKGKILVASVKGDIHDIGKNIVKVVLENYGYTVVDLGRDVAPEAIVDTAEQQDIRLVGLSALMTTTVPAMTDTIAALRHSGHDCKIWVGGAVLTPAYAAEIGADYYAADAKQSVDIARKVLG